MNNKKEHYPDKMLRGISTNKFVIGGVVTDEAFNLDPVREDGFCEISVTWYDEPEALNVLMTQRKSTGEIQFSAGAVEIDRSDLNEKMKVHFLENRLSYERKPTYNNKYHGNILVNNNTDSHMKRLIKFGLATIAGGNIYRNPNV